MRKIKDICYSKSGHKNQKLDLYLPDSEEFCVFIYFHGGGLEAGSKDIAEIFAPYFTDRNIACVSAEYRMYPEAVFPEFIKDAAACVAWVKNNIENYGKCKGIYVGGSSAGGYLSMMLCFDKKYLAPFGIKPTDIDGFVHDAGQATSHFNVLRERGIDTKRVIIDETAPLYFVGTEEEYSRMLIIVSDDDMQNRFEQTMLLISTLKHFGHEDKTTLKVMNGTHCHYVEMLDENNDSVLAKLVADFIKELGK